MSGHLCCSLRSMFSPPPRGRRRTRRAMRRSQRPSARHWRSCGGPQPKGCDSWGWRRSRSRSRWTRRRWRSSRRPSAKTIPRSRRTTPSLRVLDKVDPAPASLFAQNAAIRLQFPSDGHPRHRGSRCSREPLGCLARPPRRCPRSARREAAPRRSPPHRSLRRSSSGPGVGAPERRRARCTGRGRPATRADPSSRRATPARAEDVVKTSRMLR